MAISRPLHILEAPRAKEGKISRRGASRLIGRYSYEIEHDPGSRRIYPKRRSGTTSRRFDGMASCLLRPSRKGRTCPIGAYRPSPLPHGQRLAARQPLLVNSTLLQPRSVPNRFDGCPRNAWNFFLPCLYLEYTLTTINISCKISPILGTPRRTSSNPPDCFLPSRIRLPTPI